MVWSCVIDCMALALRPAKGVGGSQTKHAISPNGRAVALPSSLSDAGCRSDDCMPRHGSNLNH
ncbi:hypothetical protein HaLaN_31524 [Haematococcus lacustris]|uniref:Uncharacterized protein n=1 Tax=Haematococcus lacustris TaxID=44745 RepID=A0A6A0AHZ7_HAELA|nr:hypothetical protein HaLaN_31524 [Haematococcus lacustris]